MTIYVVNAHVQTYPRDYSCGKCTRANMFSSRDYLCGDEGSK